jgi:hypothetical protein
MNLGYNKLSFSLDLVCLLESSFFLKSEFRESELWKSELFFDAW